MLGACALVFLAFTGLAAGAEEAEPPPTDPVPTTDVPLVRDPVFLPPETAPGVANPMDHLRTYAGVGGEWAYGDAGTAELGGSLSFSTSSDVTTFSADPMVGFFLLDHLELSLIGQVRYAEIDGAASTRLGLVGEPSTHVPIADGLLWAAGVGLGGAVGALADDDEVALAFVLAPRTGLQVLVGRSGLLNLGVRYQALFRGDDDAPDLENAPDLAFANTFDVLAGYSIIF